jgi:DNA-binding NarL/FixJ family response regulator
MAIDHERCDDRVIWLHARSRRQAPAPRLTTVVLAGGRSLMRAGIRALLERDGQIEVVGDTACGDVAATIVRRERPDVVLVVPGKPEDPSRAPVRLGPLAATGVAVLLLAEPDADAALDAALRAGARGALSGDPGPADLAHAVRMVARGDAVLSPAAAGRLLNLLNNVMSSESQPSEEAPWNSAT